MRLHFKSNTAHPRWIRKLAASPDGKLIASVADDMVCRVWNAASGELVHELRGHESTTPHHFPSMLYACGFSADSSLLATADRVGRVVVWDTAAGKQVGMLEVPGMYTPGCSHLVSPVNWSCPRNGSMK